MMAVEQHTRNKSTGEQSSHIDISNISLDLDPIWSASSTVQVPQKRIYMRGLGSPGMIENQNARISSSSPQVPSTSRDYRHVAFSEHPDYHKHAQGDDTQPPEIVIAVLGCTGVGKSAFIKNALDLKNSPVPPISSKKVSLKGYTSILHLVELDVRHIRISQDKFHWPARIQNQVIPEIDGFILLYSVADHGSIDYVPDFLNTLKHQNVPTILVASKCDLSTKRWSATSKKIDGIYKNNKSVNSLQTTLNSPETHKRCISIILSNIMLELHGDPCRYKHNRRHRAATTSQCTSSANPVYVSKSLNDHRRVSSDAQSILSQGRSQLHARNPGYISPPQSPSDSEPNGMSSEPMSSDQLLISSSLQVKSFSQHEKDVVCTPSRLDYQTSQLIFRPSIPHGTEIIYNNSSINCIDNLTIDEEQNEKTAVSLVETYKPPRGDESGIPFEDLVHRLLSPPRSKNDTKFIMVFLCLYRKFATPTKLLEAIIQHFENLTELDVPDLVKLTERLRYLNVLQVWVSGYPGDFAHPVTRQIIAEFVQMLDMNPDFAVVRKELMPLLDISHDDDDIEWALSDHRGSRASTMESFLTSSSRHSVASTVTANSSTEDIIDLKGLEKVAELQSARVSNTPLDSAQEHPAGQLAALFQSLPRTPETARHQAQFLSPLHRYALDKLHWDRLVDIPVESIALELTRIDWILYSSIKPRDLIRHISLNADIKGKRQSLQHVNRMIDEFNHVAFWVTNMILLRDKPKHRAIILEKFMNVAWKLRYLNNYNSLGAIIAGINGTAVHRLVQTKELIPREIRKQFMRLEILMGTAKSHSAYRLGWQNTSSPRIPFLPLHRRDLIFAEEGNRTFIRSDEGDRINWKKFEIMGDAIIEIRNSQEMPYPNIKRNEEVQKLVLDGRFSKDEDELFERSVQLEGQTVVENTRRRLNWFQR